MKHSNFALLLIFPAVMLLTSINEHKVLDDNPKFDIAIEQNGVQQKIKDDAVALSKQTFDLVLRFSEPMGVLVNASYTDKTFKLAAKNKPLHKLPGFEETGMAEGLLNENREILIARSAPNYWFYDSENEHRFNQVEKPGNEIVCKRSIETLHDVDSKIKIKVSAVGQPLYLVFVSYKRDGQSSKQIELQRHFVKIDWKK